MEEMDKGQILAFVFSSVPLFAYIRISFALLFLVFVFVSVFSFLFFFVFVAVFLFYTYFSLYSYLCFLFLCKYSYPCFLCLPVRVVFRYNPFRITLFYAFFLCILIRVFFFSCSFLYFFVCRHPLHPASVSLSDFSSSFSPCIIFLVLLSVLYIFISWPCFPPHSLTYHSSPPLFFLLLYSRLHNPPVTSPCP